MLNIETSTFTFSTYILLFLIVFFPAICFGQSGGIDGRVFDAKTGLSLSGANITIIGTTTGAAADSLGYYTIERLAPGRYTIKATLIGYTPEEQQVVVTNNQVRTVDFYLEQQVSEFEEVMVTSHSEASEIRESSFPVAVLDGQRLANRGISLDEAISRATGVQVRRSGGLGSASVFNIRGLEGQRIQIYINGNAADISGNAFSLDDIPVQLVDRIEVYKGIVPARLGGDGLGAAINVVTIEPDGGYLDAGYTLGSFGQHQISATGLRRFGPVQAGISVNMDYAKNDYTVDNPYRPGLRMKRKNDRFQRTLVGALVKTDRLLFDKVEMEAAVLDATRDIQGLQSNVQHAHTTSQFGVLVLHAESEDARDGRLDVRFGFVGLKSNSALVDTSRFRYDFDGGRFQSPSGRGELGILPSHSDNHSNQLRHRGTFTYRLGILRESEYVHTANLTYALDWSRYQPKDPLANQYAGRNVSEFPGEKSSAVAGLSHEWRPFGEKFIAVTGFKGYAFHATGTESALYSGNLDTVPPKITNQTTSFGVSEALRYRFSPKFLGKMSVELARRIPSSDELFGDGMLISPNPVLEPEQSLNFTTGVQFDYSTQGGRRFQAEFNLFWLKLRDMIRLTGGSDGRAAYDNMGEVRIAGFDAEVKADITRWLYGQAAFTFQDARDIQRYEPGTKVPNPTYDLRIPHEPWLFGNATLEAHKTDLFGRSQRSRLFTETSYTEEYFYAFELSQRQERRIPRSIITTVGIEQSWLNTGLTLTAEVQNITDEQVLNLFNQPLPGRMFRMKLRYTLIEN